jgi:exodeoxyribonuclease VII small subunit
MPRAQTPKSSSTDAAPESSAGTQTFDFEQAMNDLEAVVERLERGDVPLEEAMRSFERGMALSRACQDALTTAEQKVELLASRSDGSHVAEDFADLDDDAP